MWLSLKMPRAAWCWVHACACGRRLVLMTVGIQRKWPEEKLPIGVESLRNFNVRAKVVGPSGTFVKYIQQETGTRVQIKGIGSGFVDQETGQEANEPMHIHVTYVHRQIVYKR